MIKPPSDGDSILFHKPPVSYRYLPTTGRGYLDGSGGPAALSIAEGGPLAECTAGSFNLRPDAPDAAFGQEFA